MTNVIGLLLIMLVPAGAWAQSGPLASTASCNPTPIGERLSVVGPMVGSRPAWMVGSDQTFGSANPVKTLWVLAQSKQRLRITGRLLNGSATAQFRHGSGPLTRDLVVEDLARSSVVPGGATPEMLREYAFIMSHVFYPVPGCWEFTVAIGDAKHTIVRTIGTSTPP